MLKQGGDPEVIEKLRDGLAIGGAGFLERMKALGRKKRAESRDARETSDSGPRSRGGSD